MKDRDKFENPISASGCLTGHIKKTESWIRIKTVQVDLDFDTAFALCNVLHHNELDRLKGVCTPSQFERLLHLGAAIGQLVENSSKYNVTEDKKDEH
jgi:hypothetical protein